MRRREWLCVAAVIASAGCASTPSLPPKFEPPERPTPERMLADTIAAAASETPPAPPAIAVGVTSSPTRLMAWDSQGKLLWQHAIEPRSAPLLAGSSVVIAEPSGVVVRDLQTGVTRVVLEGVGELLAADGSGDQIVIAMAERSEGNAAGSGLLAFVVGTDVRWKQRLGQPIGAPALVAGRVLVPWATHRLSILDGADGHELSRIDATRAVLGRVLVRDGKIYVGQHSLWPLSQQLLEAGSKGGPEAVATPALRVLPGQPPLLRDGYTSAPEPGSVHHRLRLDWELGPDGKTRGGALFLRFYRLLFAFDAHQDRLRWVHVLARDVVGARVVERGLLVADAGGSLHLFEHTGTQRELLRLGQPLQVLALSAPERFLPAEAGASGGGAAVGATDDALAPQLMAAATLEDARLLAGRVYAAQRLSSLPGERVTAQLVELCGARAHPAPVRRAACDGLGERPDGGPAVLAALRLGVAEPPPLDALAKAAVRMQLRQAGPLLLPYVSDVRTSAAELPVVITALATLDHKPAAAAIERFLRMHHAEPEGSELSAALQASTDALAELYARGSRATLERVAADGLSQPSLRASAEQAVATLKAGPKPKPKQLPAAAKAAAPTPPPAPPPPDPRPAELTAELIGAALAAVNPKLEKCLETAPERPRTSRLAMTVDGQGKIERVFVTPPSLQACIEPLVRAQILPATRGGRQQVNYVVRAKPTK